MQSIKNSLESTLQLEQLRTFSLVAQTGSFSAAAEQLGLTQPAVSMQVRQLERRLAVRLLERVGRGVNATAAGAELMLHVPRIATAVEAALSAVSPYASGVNGCVRLGASVTTCLYLLPQALRQLRDAFPALRIVVSTGNTEELVRAIESNTLDLALVTLPVSSRSLSTTPIFKDEFVAIGRVNTCAWPKRLTQEALGTLRLVKFGRGTTTQGIVDQWLRKRGPVPQPVMELDSVEAIKAVVAAGLGCAIVPRMAVTGRGHDAELALQTLSPRLYRTLAILARNDKPMTHALRAVFDAVVKAGEAATRASGA
ncbi:LysR family transcriptional regulator [Pseudorhodoferax sp. Leaf274]|uniref:LysR family transcriptional regulator n=1 Tax=Pseudorhodoferax sp. Leaf274 TaxID=1736318 RepID=UPI0007035BDF|nr:LysR family transcriptional regulator [Pseudorhodoferax sp. Leaf274]KQP49069.1 LysR family transcriptional regulator [Pseudorhodoferax sp. Leaf274]